MFSYNMQRILFDCPSTMNLEKVKQLTNNGKNINIRETRTRNMLLNYICISYDPKLHKESLIFLLKNEADPFICNKYGRDSLFYAITEKIDIIIDFLINKKINVYRFERLISFKIPEYEKYLDSRVEHVKNVRREIRNLENKFIHVCLYSKSRKVSDNALLEIGSYIFDLKITLKIIKAVNTELNRKIIP